MKNTINFRKSLVFIVSIAFLVSSLVMFFASSANASENKQPSNEELGKEAEFIQNEAIQKDENGQPTGLDLDKVKERHGYVPQEAKEADVYLKEKSQDTATRAVGDNYQNSSDCIMNEITSSFGQALPPAVAEAFKAGNYQGAFKRLGKAGFKGSGFGTVYTIAIIIML